MEIFGEYRLFLENGCVSRKCGVCFSANGSFFFSKKGVCFKEIVFFLENGCVFQKSGVSSMDK